MFKWMEMTERTSHEENGASDRLHGLLVSVRSRPMFALVVLTIIGLFLNVSVAFLPTSLGVYVVLTVYSMSFIVCTLLVLRDTNALNGRFMIVVLTCSVFVRIPLLLIEPIVSNDLARSLMFADAFLQGYDPYSHTGSELCSLASQGVLELRVSPVRDWGNHTFDYPVLAILFFAFAVFVASPFSSSLLIVVATKTLLSVADYITAWLIYRIFRDNLVVGERSGKKAAMIFLLNPISLYEVSLEGQIEGFAVMFAVAAVYVALASKRAPLKLWRRDLKIGRDGSACLCGILIALGVLVKYSPILLMPIVLAVLTKRRLIAIAVTSFVAALLVASLPHLLSGSYVLSFFSFQIVRNDNSNVLVFNLFRVFCTLASTIIFWEFSRPYVRAREATGVVFNVGAWFTSISLMFIGSFHAWYLLILVPLICISGKRGSPCSNALAWLLLLFMYNAVRVANYWPLV